MNQQTVRVKGPNIHAMILKDIKSRDWRKVHLDADKRPFWRWS